MGIYLSEHIKQKLLVELSTDEVQVKKKNALYFSKENLELIKNRKVPVFKNERNQNYNCFKIKEIENGLELQADYYIGIDWLIENERYIVIEPKINKKVIEQFEEKANLEENKTNKDLDKESKQKVKNEKQEEYKELDYLKMLLDVMAEPKAAKHLEKLMIIDWEAPLIAIDQQKDQLTPFLVVQFLQLLKNIVRKGLKKSYYTKQENLKNRVKGKVLVSQHIKQNVLKNRFTHTLCQYQVFGVDNTENRFLKKVWHFCSAFINNNEALFHDNKTKVNDLLNYTRPAFEQIGESYNVNDLKKIKHNPFYKEYKEAIRIGNYILKKFSYNISKTAQHKSTTPPFWIDMPLLFELYVYRNLIQANPIDSKKIHFQFSTYGNALDFLVSKKDNEMVIDAKYKLKYSWSKVHQDIRQVSGYARLTKVREKLNINKESDRIIDCLIIYPLVSDNKQAENIYSLEYLKNYSNEISAYHRVYKVGVNLPLIKPEKQ